VRGILVITGKEIKQIRFVKHEHAQNAHGRVEKVLPYIGGGRNPQKRLLKNKPVRE
jgi:hypothetical protein